jgi:hypothetical protein
MARSIYLDGSILADLEEAYVIARIWHGYTAVEDADAYEAMLKPELLPGISRVNGYRGSYLLKRDAGAEVEFITILLFDSVDSIRAISGPDYETAVIPDERRKYLTIYFSMSFNYVFASTQGFVVIFLVFARGGFVTRRYCVKL